jgi:hypothetical protein
MGGAAHELDALELHCGGGDDAHHEPARLQMWPMRMTLAS